MDDVIRKRSFVRRGKEVFFYEVNNILAIRSNVIEGLKSCPPLRPDELLPFQSSGWVFVSSDDKESLCGRVPFKVFVGPGGRVFLGGVNLFVGFRPTTPKSEIISILGKFGLILIECDFIFQGICKAELRFNDFNVFDISKSLLELEEVEFSEPELFESFCQRLG